MIWNILSHKFSYTSALLIVTLLLSSVAAIAQPQVTRFACEQYTGYVSPLQLAFHSGTDPTLNVLGV